MSRRKSAHRAKACPCGSGRIYRECSGVYHGGEPTPDTVTRSRYSAYALGLSDYFKAKLIVSCATMSILLTKGA
ncbi:MAG: hypothetical protein AAFX94_10610 [Myxococcota bacterium]